jgi:hypothetical protein
VTEVSIPGTESDPNGKRDILVFSLTTTYLQRGRGHRSSFKLVSALYTIRKGAADFKLLHLHYISYFQITVGTVWRQKSSTGDNDIDNARDNISFHKFTDSPFLKATPYSVSASLISISHPSLSKSISLLAPDSPFPLSTGWTLSSSSISFISSTASFARSLVHSSKFPL